MSIKTKVVLITLGFAVPAFFAGPIIWPIADIGVEPTGAQLPAFLFLAVGDALLFGAGIAFMVFGLPLVRRLSGGSRTRAWAMYLSISYLMVSWWPHLNMHNNTGFDLGGLLFIDYVFHFPLEIAASVLAACFYSIYRQRERTATAGPAAPAQVLARS